MTHEYERVLTPQDGLRLHLNENTAGCSTRVIEAIRAMSREQMAFYPDYDAAIEACAQRLEVDADELLLTNGLDEGILAVSVAALRHSPADRPFEAIVIQPAFDMYAACADAAGGRVVEIAPEPDFAFPLTRVLDAVNDRTRLIFLTNPNNPTGLVIPPDVVLAIADRARHALVLLDEAYVDFGSWTFVGDEEAAKFPHVIVGRTFAKAYGFAGLRAGALIGDPATLAPIRRVVPPYSLNACAAAALPAAMGDREHYEWYVGQVMESKALLSSALSRLSIKYWPSAANFILARVGDDVAEVVGQLAERGIHVRNRSKDPGCAGCIRITAGVVDHTRACIAALEEVMCGAR